MRDSSQGNPQELKKKTFKEIFLENDFGMRIIVGIIFTIILALFLHFREVRIDVLELNTVANKYIVGQVDFEFPDQEATIILKQEALRDISNIYRIEEKQIRQARFEFETFLMSNREWRDRAASITFEEMYKIADAFEDVLIQSRFTDARTLQKMKDLGLSTQFYQVFTPPSVNKPIEIPSEYWRNFKNETEKLSPGFHQEGLDFVAHYFETRNWNFADDLSAQLNLRELVQKSIPDKLTRVRAGTRIIDQGERVTPRHIMMMQSMKDALGENRKVWEPLTIVSSLLMAVIITLLAVAYFYYNYPEVLQSLQKLSLLVCIIVLTLLLSKVTEYFLIHGTSGWFDMIRYPLFVPFSTILICILLSPRMALYTAAFLSIILAVTLAIDHSRFLIINLITALVVIITTRELRKRKEVFAVCGKTWLSAVPVLFAFNFSTNTFWTQMLGTDLIISFVFMLLTALLVVGFLPLFESLFRVMTDMSLIEYMDPSNELLRRLMLEVPGTYQHCLVLGNLAEGAARSIGANGLFCRVATLYHDIGKLNNPHFFTENQTGGVNIHQLLTPMESAQVIIAHVRDGEQLARKYRLPQSFIDIIREHHGTTLVYYFYCKEVELKGGNVDEVNQKDFRYPGPKPHSKESAIIMIADTVEAASRSVEESSEESLTKMVDRLIGDKAEDGQFDECQLTFEELGIVKRTLVKSLMMTHHVRVKYPERKEKKEES